MPTMGNTDDRVLQIWLQVLTASAHCVSNMHCAVIEKL